MRAITSKDKLLKKLKKEVLITDGFRFYLSDFHRTPVGKVLANKLLAEDGLLEPSRYCAWFERAWRLQSK